MRDFKSRSIEHNNHCHIATTLLNAVLCLKNGLRAIVETSVPALFPLTSLGQLAQRDVMKLQTPAFVPRGEDLSRSHSCGTKFTRTAASTNWAH